MSSTSFKRNRRKVKGNSGYKRSYSLHLRKASVNYTYKQILKCQIAILIGCYNYNTPRC